MYNWNATMGPPGAEGIVEETLEDDFPIAFFNKTSFGS